MKSGLPDPKVTSDAKHVEIGLTDKADSARWLFHELAGRGIGPRLVAVAGDEFGPLGGLAGSDAYLLVPEASRATAFSVGAEPTGTPARVLSLRGGPEQFLAVLGDQLERRRRGDVPELDDDPAWTLEIVGVDPKLERVHESLLTIADGRFGTRGAPLLAHPDADPGVLAANVYVGSGAETELAAAPEWATLPGRQPTGPALRRRLDLRTGVLAQDGRIRAVGLSSLARPGTVALRAHGSGRRPTPEGTRSEFAPGASLALDDRWTDGTLERIGAYGADEAEARAALAEATAAGFEQLLVEHRSAWARRWSEADVVIEGDRRLQLAVRFALFHLMASRRRHGRGGRGRARALRDPTTAVMSSGTATSSCCRSSRRRIPQPPARCWSTASAACRLRVSRRAGWGARAPASRGSRRPTGST